MSIKAPLEVRCGCVAMIPSLVLVHSLFRDRVALPGNSALCCGDRTRPGQQPPCNPRYMSAPSPYTNISPLINKKSAGIPIQTMVANVAVTTVRCRVGRQRDGQGH